MSDERDTPDIDVTAILRRASSGEPEAWEDAYRVLYGELRAVAAVQLASEAEGHTLQPTALLNEAYLKLARNPPDNPSDRHHFIRIAAKAMRQVLVDHARTLTAAKRGGGARPATLDERVHGETTDPVELIALDEALERLDGMDSRLRQVVELRYFGGLKDDEVAEVMGTTRRTVLRRWATARAWLHRELSTRDLRVQA